MKNILFFFQVMILLLININSFAGPGSLSHYFDKDDDFTFLYYKDQSQFYNYKDGQIIISLRDENQNRQINLENEHADLASLFKGYNYKKLNERVSSYLIEFSNLKTLNYIIQQNDKSKVNYLTILQPKDQESILSQSVESRVEAIIRHFISSR